jgi:peptide subunit release factor 1 (eRF1)
VERVALAEWSVDTFVIEEGLGEDEFTVADAEAEAEEEAEGRAVNEENVEYEGREDKLTVALELAEDDGLYVALALGVQLG